MRWRKRTRYTKKPHPGRTAVYQFRDATTQAHLYVGVTNDIERRFGEHAGIIGNDPRKWWWNQADHRHVTITWYPTRRQALAVETGLIKRLRPPGNKVNNPDWEATTTWRPPTREAVVPTFRGAANPLALAVAAWTFPVGTLFGLWDAPPALYVGGLVVGVMATRTTWKRLTA